MIDFLIEPLDSGFMQRAMIAAVMVGAISGVIGSFVVVRGMSFFGDALAHTTLPGVAVAYIYWGSAGSLPVIGGLFSGVEEQSVQLFAGGLVAGIISALFIGWLTRDRRLKEDTAIGIIFVAMFALGIGIISTDPRAYQGQDLTHILFGYIFGIGEADLWITAACGLVVIGVIVLFYKELVLVSFDSRMAKAMKLPSEGLRLLLLVLIAVTIVASLRIVGIALMLAMLTTPAATAQLLTHRMHHMIVVAAVLGALSGAVGIYISWYFDVVPGPAIVLAITTIFVIVFSLTQFRIRLAQTT